MGVIVSVLSQACLSWGGCSCRSNLHLTKLSHQSGSCPSEMFGVKPFSFGGVFCLEALLYPLTFGKKVIKMPRLEQMV